MKRSTRVLAMMLAIVFAVYGYPIVPTSAEEDTGGVITETAPGEENTILGEETVSDDGNAAVQPSADTLAEEEPAVDEDTEDLENNSNMKFVQTGFDSDTGMLTMTLKIKPTTVSYDGGGNYTGTHISEGFFAFSVNPESVVPYTVKTEGGKLVPDVDLLAVNGTMEFVGGGDNLPNTTTVFQNFLNSENSRGNRVNGSFNSAMGETKFDNQYSGFFTSASRLSETGLIDCYLQFRIDPATATVPETDGYVSVANVYFLCYSTEKNGMEYVVASSDDELFCSSIQIPDTPQEARDIVAQFYTMKDEPTSPTLALGAAGYVEKYLNPTSYHPDYYYYLDDERIDLLKTYQNNSTEMSETFWQQKAAWNNGRNPAFLEGTPYLYFRNVNKTYLLQGFTVMNRNTFDSEAEIEAGEIPEFYRPDGEAYYYPRYSVPTGVQNDVNDEAENWRPLSYVPANAPEGTVSDRIELKYDIRTEVSDSSISNPETDDQEQFFDSIKWEFALRDGTPLSSCTTTNIAGSGKEVRYYAKDSVTPTTVYAVEAYLNGGNYILWNVYESESAFNSGAEPIMTTPVGVLMELADSSITIVSMDESLVPPADEEATPDEGENGEADEGDRGTVIEVIEKAPQLHVTNAAADVRSYLWNNDAAAYNGQIIIKATYTSKLGDEYTADATTVKLYKEEAKPTSTTLDVSEVGTVSNGTSDVRGFEVSLNDRLAAGIPVYSYVYDQYYTRMDSAFSELSFETDEIAPAGKKNAFTVTQDSDNKNKYYITYGKSEDGMTYNVNEAFGGLYTLTASCDTAATSSEDIFVSKAAEELTYLELATSTGTADTVGGKSVVYVDVPALGSNGDPQTATMNINITVLANQWYLSSNSQQASRYDIAQNIRNTSGFIDLTAARNHVEITYDADYAAGTDISQQKGVNGQQLDKGILTYDTTIANNVEYIVTVDATYEGKTVTKQLSIIFRHSALELNKIELSGATSIVVDPTSTKTVTLSADVKDQYGQMWSWAGVENAYGPGGRLNQTGTEKVIPWTIELVEGTTLPSDGSIALSGDHKEKITVTSTAESRTLKVQAVFTIPNINNSGMPLTFRSAVYTIEVKREASKPSSVTASYGTTTFIPGMKSATGSANDQEFTPTVTVKDQYGATMSPSDYTLSYSLRVTGSTDGKVYLERELVDVEVDDGAGGTTTEQVWDYVGEKTGKIIVEECAQNASAEITVIAVGKNAGSSQIRLNIDIRRNAPDVSTIDISTASVDYPKATEPSSYAEQLSAMGSTQYGDNEDIESSALSWELVSVTVGGTKHEGSAAVGKGINLNASTGAVTFDRTLTSRAAIPTSFEVKVIYISNRNVYTTESVNVNLETAKANSVTVLESSYNNGIEVPTAGSGSASINLQGEVLDQYGLRMTDAALTWSIEGYDPAENADNVSIEGDTGKLTVDYNTEGGFVSVKGSYTDSGSTISKTVDVPVKVPGSNPAYVNFRQLKNSAGEIITLTETKDPSNENIVTATAAEIPLPSALEKSATYDISGRVLDQYLKILAGESINWSVDSTDNLTNATINSSSGRLTVNYTPEARDATNGESVIVVKASADGGAVVGILTITVKKQEDKASYAVPDHTIQNDSDGGSRETAEGYAIVPKRDEEDTNIKYTATVYSQYGEVMADEDYTLKLVTTAGDALSFTETADGADLAINSKMTGAVVEVVAYADDNPNFTVTDSSVIIQLYRGSAYPFELVLGSSAAGDDNLKTVPLPYWQTTAVENISSEVTYAEFSFDALVIDQFDAEYTGGAYPVWEIVTETDASGNPVLPDGVRFSSKNTFKPGSTTQVTGKTVILEIGSTAVTPTELEKEIKFNVWTEDNISGNTPYSDASYKKTLTFKIKRDAASPRYLYFSSVDDRSAVTTPDVDENGDAEFGFGRPTTAEISKLYTLSPKVFDQYGFHLTEEFIQMDLDYSESSSLATGYQLVTTYAKGESAEDGNIPQTYAIWKLPITDDGAPTPTVAGTDTKVPTGSVLMAEFNTVTGELVLYSTCTITELGFSADSAALGATKNILVPLVSEERVATSVEIVRGYDGTYTINKSSDENLTEDVSAVIYDQYGERYAKTDIVVDWKLMLPDADEDGELDEYIEYLEDDTTRKDAADYLVLMSNPTTAESAKQITIQQQQFETTTNVIMVATLRRRNATSQLAISASSTISMRARSSGSSYYASLYFEAGGEYGKLVGPAMVSVPVGEYPAEIPGVKTIEGYGFEGWTSDGYTIVDPMKMIVTGDVLYYAVYKDVTTTDFIDGYKDRTVRPNENITRAEYVKMVVEATCPDFDPELTYDAPFKDVDKTMWYAKYIGFAYGKGFVDGYGDDNFKPENYITRAEAVKILADAAAIADAEELSEFSDVDRSRWYAIYIDILYSIGVIDGYPDGTFRPNDYVTRAESAKLVVSITENALSDLAKRNIIENAYCPFTDIRRSHWAYAYILRAAGIA